MKFNIFYSIVHFLIRISIFIMIEMIENISNSIVPPPLSLTDCLFDGQIDPIRYLFYQRRYSDPSYSQDICAAIIKKRKSAVPILSIKKNYIKDR